MKNVLKIVKRSLLICAFLFAFLISSGCGTFIHPERRGQEVTQEHELDVGIAVLDGVGLLFFLIPGLIAYAIDFSNGTIYVPPGELDTLGENHSSIHHLEEDERNND